MTDKHGYIYVLTNTSFPEYVKIGYADNVDERVAQLNRSECTPFAFKKYDANTKVDYSYDIAILRLNECGQYVILKNEKQGRQDDYHYVPLPDCGDFNERYKKVKTQEAWALLRDKYKVKKGKYQYTNQDDRPASFSLLGQAVNEVIQKLEL